MKKSVAPANDAGVLAMDRMVQRISRKYREIHKAGIACLNIITTMRRDVGEELLCHFSAKAAKFRGKFEDLDSRERQALREDAEGITRDNMAEVGDALQKAGLPMTAVSVTSLYEALRLAVAYKPSDLMNYTRKGFGVQQLLTCASLADDADRHKALETASEQGAVTAEAVGTIVEEVAAQSASGFTKETTRARKAAASRKKGGGGGRKPRDNSGIPSDAATLAGDIVKMTQHLDDRLCMQMSNLGVRYKNDYPDLSTSDQEEVDKKISELLPHLDTLDTATKWIRDIRNEFKQPKTSSIKAGALKDRAKK